MSDAPLATSQPNGVLHVIHGHGGGTEHHARALIDASRDRYRHHLAIAVGARWQVEAHGPGGAVRSFEFSRDEGETWAAFVGGALRIVPDRRRPPAQHHRMPRRHHRGHVGARRSVRIHGSRLQLRVPDDPVPRRRRHVLRRADRPFVLRALPRCAGAVRRGRHRGVARPASRAPRSRGVPDRSVALDRRDAGEVLPRSPIDVIPHGAPGAWAMATVDGVDDAPTTVRRGGRALPLPGDGVPTVAVLGAVGPDKGARRLERLADLVRATGARVRFVLIGYMDVQHGPWQSDDAVLTVHGRYEPNELPQLFADYRVRLVAYPSAGPETFSLTLSEAWAAGLPVMVPPFGALAERVAGTGAGWVWGDAEWRDEARMLARIAEAVAPEHSDALAAAAECALRIPQPTLPAMAERTIAHYDAAIAASASRRARPPLRMGPRARGRGARRDASPGVAAMSACRNARSGSTAAGRINGKGVRSMRCSASGARAAPIRGSRSAVRAGRSALAARPRPRCRRGVARGDAARPRVSRAVAGTVRGATRGGRRGRRARCGRARAGARPRQCAGAAGPGDRRPRRRSCAARRVLVKVLEQEPALAAVPALAAPLAVALDRATAGDAGRRSSRGSREGPNSSRKDRCSLRTRREYAASASSGDTVGMRESLVAMLRDRACRAGRARRLAPRRSGDRELRARSRVRLRPQLRGLVRGFARARGAPWLARARRGGAPASSCRRRATACRPMRLARSRPSARCVRAHVRRARNAAIGIAEGRGRVRARNAPGRRGGKGHRCAGCRRARRSRRHGRCGGPGARAAAGAPDLDAVLVAAAARGTARRSSVRRRAALTAALVALHESRDGASDCPVEAATLAGMWADAIRAHQQGDRPLRAPGTRGFSSCSRGTRRRLPRGRRAPRGGRCRCASVVPAALEAAPRYTEARLAAANAAMAAARPTPPSRCAKRPHRGREAPARARARAPRTP